MQQQFSIYFARYLFQRRKVLVMICLCILAKCKNVGIVQILFIRPPFFTVLVSNFLNSPTFQFSAKK